MRLCEECKYLSADGYETPEWQCSLGILENDPHMRDDGCDYTDKQLCRKMNNYAKD